MSEDGIRGTDQICSRGSVGALTEGWLGIGGRLNQNRLRKLQCGTLMEEAAPMEVSTVLMSGITNHAMVHSRVPQKGVCTYPITCTLIVRACVKVNDPDHQIWWFALAAPKFVNCCMSYYRKAVTRGLQPLSTKSNGEQVAR